MDIKDVPITMQHDSIVGSSIKCKAIGKIEEHIPITNESKNTSFTNFHAGNSGICRLTSQILVNRAIVDIVNDT